MAAESISGCPFEDTDLVKKFLGKDAIVLTDIKSNRSVV